MKWSDFKIRFDESSVLLYQLTYDQHAADQHYKESKKLQEGGLSRTYILDFSVFHRLTPKECAIIIYHRNKSDMGIFRRLKLINHIRRHYK